MLRDLEPTRSSSDAALLVLGPVVGFAALLLAAAAISPARVPWPRVAAGLNARRADLATVGFAAAGIAFVSFCLRLLGA